MRESRYLIVLFLLGYIGAAASVRAQQPDVEQPQQQQGQSQQPSAAEQVASLPWVGAPAIAPIANVAQLALSGNLHYLDADSTRKFLVLNGNPSAYNEYTIAPQSLRWFAIFSFDGSGYVRDNETLDNDAIFRTLKQNNDRDVAERRRLGLTPLYLEGWAVAPHYDVQTHQLEWGERLRDDAGNVIVNYTIRMLGRSGVMQVILVSSPESLTADIHDLHTALGSFNFIGGQTYGEFREGDRVAEYGLGALIVGGAAAAAASSGVMKGLGKFIGLAVVGAFAAVVQFFKGLFRRKPVS